ncbi:phosphatidylglycerol lysyltransferase domain-containing protein [Streptomyces olivaceoviridis]|uniref:phosphatidylglycerol lysyltransferase domain-containing protein n=1 Tax=Streptomyces olivaceoviridis TaxID=1921 RepID=UPI0036D0A889
MTFLFGALALLNAAATLFRSQRLEAALHGDEEARIRALLAAYGHRDSLGYFATRRDKAVVFSLSGKAAVTYRVEAGVCLASGDPVGDPEARPRAIDAWLDLACRHAWAPAVMGASEAGARACARASLGALQLGDEAILHVPEFDLAGRRMRVTRQAVHRIRRTGAVCRIRRHAHLGEREMEQIVRKADAWRDTETERGFSMALDRLGDPADGDCLLVEALGEDGRLLALLSFVPWGRDGVSLDLMRRDRAAPNGVMEFMVTELCAAAPKPGVRRVSLNFAAFRSAFEEGARIGAGPVLRLWRRLLLFLSHWWQLEALYRSDAKYLPEWYPRFICYGDTASLARIGLASAIAEGFVSVPSLRKLWRKGHPDSGRRPATTAGPPSAPVSGPAGGDGAGPAAPAAGPPDQVRVRYRTLDRLRATVTSAPGVTSARAWVGAGTPTGRGSVPVGTHRLPRCSSSPRRSPRPHLHHPHQRLRPRPVPAHRPELYLKRLCVGGVEKVFELGRAFRNEGVSHQHNPEFTMLEAYQAHADYDVMPDLARELVQGAATAAFGSPVARRDGGEHDISGTRPVKTVYGALCEVFGEEIGPGTGLLRLHRLCDRTGVPYTAYDGPGDVVLEMYERLVEHRTGPPTFHKGFPADVSPPTRRHRTEPRLAERWDLVAFGTELGTAYSELTDPVEQRRRLTAQSLPAAAGDPEAMELDEDFLEALAYAMPPTGGLGLGVDRVVMFLTGLTIRETLPFPLVRRR